MSMYLEVIALQDKLTYTKLAVGVHQWLYNLALHIVLPVMT